MKITGNASASAPKTGGRLAGKDFINIGIFTAIYFVVVFAVACLGFHPHPHGGDLRNPFRSSRASRTCFSSRAPVSSE